MKGATKEDPGTFNYLKVHEAIRNIEYLTKRFKRNRINTERYIQEVNQNLANMTSQRNYIEYLRNIGQLN
jgi:hypothetical protein